MKADELIAVYKEYMDNLDSNKLNRLLASNNRLYRHSVINRVLIDIQCCKMVVTSYSDVRTKEEWYALGREVIDKTKVIQLINPIKTVVYRDRTTGKTVTSDDLSYEEINLALKYELLERDEESCFMEVVNGYELSNTQVKNVGYRGYANIGFFEINDIMKKLYNKSFSVGNSGGSSIAVPKEPMQAIEIICNEICKSENIECTEQCKVALKSLLGIEEERNLSCVNDIELENIYSIVRKIVSESQTNKIANAAICDIDIGMVERSKKILNVIKASSWYVDLYM